MNPLRLACLLGIAGGGTWVARFLLARGDAAEAPYPVLFWIGAVLLTAMGLVFSVLAVRHAPVWLKLVVAVSGPTLGWMVLLALYDPADSSGVGRPALEGVVGALSILVAGLRWRGSRDESRHKGSHSRSA